MSPATDDSLTFFTLVDDHCGHAEQQSEQHKSGDLLLNYILLKYYTPALLDHKMALALCAQLAYLSVLKLSSELHGGGTGRAETLESLRTVPLLAGFPPSNTSANSNLRFCLHPTHF